MSENKQAYISRVHLKGYKSIRDMAIELVRISDMAIEVARMAIELASISKLQRKMKNF